MFLHESARQKREGTRDCSAHVRLFSLWCAQIRKRGSCALSVLVFFQITAVSHLKLESARNRDVPHYRLGTQTQQRSVACS